MRYRYSYLITVVLTLFLAACGGQSVGDVSGTWNGQLNTQESIVLRLEQNGTSVSGPVTLASYPFQFNGTTTGTILTLSSQQPGGSFRIEASISGNTMQGNITALLNSGESGVFTFTASR